MSRKERTERRKQLFRIRERGPQGGRTNVGEMVIGWEALGIDPRAVADWTQEDFDEVNRMLAEDLRATG